MKEVVIQILKKALKKMKVSLTEEEIEKVLEIPPSLDMGDYSFPCFFLVETMKAPPHEISMQLRKYIGNIPQTELDDVTVSGAYVNFFIDRKNMARKLVWDAIQQKSNFGKSKIGNKQKIIFEFSSPNIAKPLSIGHLRPTIIGNSLSNIAEFLGYKVKRINYLGDWGTQFGKLIYGFEKFGNEDKLMKHPMKYMMDLYVRISKVKKYEEPSRQAFQRLEAGDKKARMLWKVFRNLSLKDFQRIYKILKIDFDEYASESQAAKNSKKVLHLLEDKDLIKKSKGALIVDLQEYNLGVSLMQKKDGATLYATRDLAEAIRRYEKYKFNLMIYQVGQEQKLHFKQIFKILELLGYKWAKNCIHSEHGLYLDKKGKRFATRKGKTILIDDILEETKKLTRKEIKKRFPKISKPELEDRALKVALAAIFYGDLKNNKNNNIVFDLKKFTSFDGNTGPYILYTYARAGSILNKKIKNQPKFEIKELYPKELELVSELSKFSEVVQKSFKDLNPSIIANFCYSSCQKFNEFYHSCPVLNSEQEAFRLALVEAFRQILRNASHLLGIDVVEEM